MTMPSADTRHRVGSEDGLALIYALFAVLVLAGLASVFAIRSVNESRFTGNNRNYETAIHLAEAGADEVLANHVNDENLQDPYVTMGPPPDCLQNDNCATVAEEEHALTASGEDAEQRWAIQVAEAAATADPDNLVRTPEGDFYGIRPLVAGADRSDADNASDVEQLVYGVGFVPSWDASNRRERVVKLKITREFFTPDFALLTGSELKIGGNGKILTPDCDPSAPDEDECDANVHANGNVNSSGSSWEVHGSVTSSGSVDSCPSTVVGGCSSNEDDEEVPPIKARDFYGREGPYNNDPGGSDMTDAWYDLCPDGTVHEQGPTPCAGDEIWPLGSNETTFRGWKYNDNGGKRVWESNAVEAGVFYIYHADASINGTAAGPNGSKQRAVSIFIEGSPDSTVADGGSPTALTGPEVSGSLATGGNPDMVAALPDALFIADRDIRMKGTGGGGAQDDCDPETENCDVQRYSGFITAWEQIDFSGNVNLDGAILTQDEEDLSRNSAPAVKRENAGINGNLTLTFDRDLTLDLKGNVVIAFWNEL